MTQMNVEMILDQLVAFPTVVGTPNHAIVDWIAEYCRSYGAAVSVLTGPEGDRSNLFVTIGPSQGRGYILSGHMDVVPAREDGWTSDPFNLRRSGDRLFGRGTSDMKGFLACALAAVPKLAVQDLRRPLHLAFSYDEEAGCRGVPHLLAALPRLCDTPLGAIIGEPSRLQAVRAHKGKAAARLEVTGRSGHSSRPDLGLNAVHAMAGIVAQVVAYGRQLEQGPLDPQFEPPCSTLQVGVIQGGQSVNIIPDRSIAEVELRAVPGTSPVALLEPMKAALLALRDSGYQVAWHDLTTYPGLSLPEDCALAALLADLTRQPVLPAVSYGTEAGLYQQAGINAIICGPGDIGRAHKPDEYIETTELTACQSLIEALGDRLAA
ncbi:acetylornithine deacetylase [Aminobacter aminovorans]|uniref:Acetylornithine deacetylase n=2 Tax=Aminobacter aminovorans TaxID=83263 RepID=A0ABR6H3S8_AMIAI|nr:acetylornithine deacetylase [Aminobacter aminovorans]